MNRARLILAVVWPLFVRGEAEKIGLADRSISPRNNFDVAASGRCHWSNTLLSSSCLTYAPYYGAMGFSLEGQPNLSSLPSLTQHIKLKKVANLINNLLDAIDDSSLESICGCCCRCCWATLVISDLLLLPLPMIGSCLISPASTWSRDGLLLRPWQQDELHFIGG